MVTCRGRRSLIQFWFTVLDDDTTYTSKEYEKFTTDINSGLQEARAFLPTGWNGKWFERARERGRPGLIMVRRWDQTESAHLAVALWFESPLAPKEKLPRISHHMSRGEPQEGGVRLKSCQTSDIKKKKESNSSLQPTIVTHDTTLMAESKEELKCLLMKMKEESEKVGLKLNIQKTNIMAFGPITSWQIDGETVETVRLYFWGLQNHCRWWLQTRN